MHALLALSFAAATLSPIHFNPSPAFDARLRDIVAAVSRERNLPELADEVEIAAATVDRPARTLTFGSFKAEGPMYPASVVKMFYLVYAYHLFSGGRLKETTEIDRALRDMVVDSSNDATGLIIDEVTGTTGGPELSPADLAKWMDKRQAVNQYFKALGFAGINACQKTWNEAPYGREKQGYGPNNELRNSLYPLACLRLMAEICLDGIVGTKECDAMRALLSRKIPAQSGDEQASDFIGRVLPSGALLWSKAGWVSSERHDVAFIRMPDGKEYVLAIFTKNHPDDKELIGDLASKWLAG